MLIAIDYETHLISQEHPAPKPVCLSYYDGKTEGLIKGNIDIYLYLKGILENPKCKIIAQNASFEGLVTTEWFPKLKYLWQQKLETGHIICTKVYEQLLDNISEKQSKAFGLDKLVKKYFDEDISAEKKDPNAWRLRYSELEDVELKDWPKEAVDYAIQDSIWAYKVYMEQKLTMVNYKLSVKADYYLNLMGNLGICTDPKKTDELEEDLLKVLNPLYELLIEKGFCEIKKGKVRKKTKLLKEYVLANIPEVEYTTKKNISVSTESLDRYLAAHPDNVIIKSFIGISKYEKIITAFISRLKNQTLIRTQYNPVVSSGRTSSRTSKAFASVNIQQMPRGVEGVRHDVRNCFVARPGYKIVSIDYNGLELASTGHQLSKVASYPFMAKLINSGDKPVDMHSMFARRLKSISENREVSYEEFVANKKKPGYKEFRTLAKPINLGFPGGIGYEVMMSLLIKEGLNLKFQVLATAKTEEELKWLRKSLRADGYPVRIQRRAYDEFRLVQDELVGLKDELFNLYPDLKEFLTPDNNYSGHFSFLTGEHKWVKNEFNEWEKEPMYKFSTEGFSRDWCMYTQICNGFLMQSPAAVGAKSALCEVVKKYQDDSRANILAFIHDEIVMEIKTGHIEEISEDVSNIMISKMQEVLTSVRIAVEADCTGDCWAKEGDGSFCKTYWKDPGNDMLKCA